MKKVNNTRKITEEIHHDSDCLMTLKVTTEIMTKEQDKG